MNSILKILLTTYYGFPLIFWLCCLTVVVIIFLGRRKFYLQIASKKRKILLKSDGDSPGDEHAVKLFDRASENEDRKSKEVHSPQSSAHSRGTPKF